MPLTDPYDTLSFHRSRVFTSHRDMSATPMKTVAKAVAKYLDTHSATAHPEREAIQFYLLNHGMSLLQARVDPLEPLEQGELQLVEWYYQMGSESALRAFNYLLVICNREARHNKAWAKTCKHIAQKNPKLAEFFQTCGHGESGIHKSMLMMPPDCTVGEYVEALCWMFYNSSWSPGYGGKAWGQVTDCLRRFVFGEYNAEMMVDTVWTLAHNNGPIFNKGFLYAHYTSEIYTILDVQRSGQIPELVLEEKYCAGHVTPAAKKVAKLIKLLFGDEVGDYVDWYVVEALGAMHKYPSQKAEQVKLYGVSEKASAAEKAAAAAAAAKAAKQKAEKEAFEKAHFQVMPNVYVKKVEMQRAA